MNVATRGEFVAAFRSAVADGRAFAAGKLGTSEKTWLYAARLAANGATARQRLAFQASQKFHALTQSGIFPPTAPFMAEFARLYAEDVRTLDFVGLTFDRPELERGVIEHYGFTNRWMDFVDQEPDRGIPADDRRCYLPAFAGKRLLLVGALAPLLCERATRETFNRVWARTGKEWFEPASVAAVAVPYGFVPATHQAFPDSLAVLADVVAQIERHDFDVALIAAGGLGVPIAAAVKRSGRSALSLGGHLQVLFGVMGQRWRDKPGWKDAYVTDAWIDVPERFKPAIAADRLLEGGAYW